MLNRVYEEIRNQFISKSSTRQSKGNSSYSGSQPQNRNQKSQIDQLNKEYNSKFNPYRRPHRNNASQFPREEKQYSRRDNKENSHSRNEENSYYGQNQKYRKYRNHNQKGGSSHRTLGGHRVRSDLY